MFERLDRSEFKFRIPVEQRDEIIRRLDDRIAVDENAGSNSTYPIVSQYYDTPDRECYWEKQDGLKHRRKLRIRVYGSEDGDVPPTIFAEIKAKSFSRGVKRRLAMPLDSALAIAAGDASALEQAFAAADTRADRMIVSEIADLVRRRQFVPSAAIRYDRMAFQGGLDREDLRVTFDSDIRCRFRDMPLVPDCKDFEHQVLDPGLSIMEVKTIGSVPIWLRDLLTDFQLRPRGFSKYCTSVENFDPALIRPALA